MASGATIEIEAGAEPGSYGIYFGKAGQAIAEEPGFVGGQSGDRAARAPSAVVRREVRLRMHRESRDKQREK